MEVLIALVIVALVAVFVAAPLRRAQPEAVADDPVMADLEARKQVKYREIRDTELDHAQGKLSDEEFARQDAELRREAIEILRRLDEAESRRRGGGAGPGV